MTFAALATGILWKDPVQRTAKTGSRYATANIRIGSNAESLFVNVIAFDDAAQSELLRLREGDSVSVQGQAKINIYTARDGEPRVSLDINAAHVLALRQPPKEKKPRPKKPKATPEQSDTEPVFVDAVLPLRPPPKPKKPKPKPESEPPEQSGPAAWHDDIPFGRA
jgi:single-stranded DNA-binding protein